MVEEGDGFAALTRYRHAALQFRVSAVMPLVLGTLELEDNELGGVREAAAALVQRIVDTAHRDGSLDGQITCGDVGTVTSPPAGSSARSCTRWGRSGVPAGTRAGEPRGTTPRGSGTAGIDTPRTRPPR